MRDLPGPWPPLDQTPETSPDHVLALQLAPGLRVVRRGRDHLQVGLYAGRRVLLPRTESAEATLDALLAHRTWGPDLDSGVLDRLRRGGCLSHRDAGAQRAHRRRAARVAVLGAIDLLDAGDLLAGAGVEVVTATGPGDDTACMADVVLVLSQGELAREQLDPLIRGGTSHLVVRLVDGTALLGPFVVPGVTACLRCIDAHRTIHDPDHVAVTNRYVRATAGARSDGAPDVEDPLLATLAVAWAVRDVVAHLDGRRPATWSRTIHLDVEPSRREEEDWSRHPECGCSWPVSDHLSGTMGA